MGCMLEKKVKIEGSGHNEEHSFITNNKQQVRTAPTGAKIKNGWEYKQGALTGNFPSPTCRVARLTFFFVLIHFTALVGYIFLLHAAAVSGGTRGGGRAAIATNNKNDDNDEYMLWSKQETYFDHCRHHKIGNLTWGNSVGPLVDKIDAKQYVEQRKIEGLKISRTLAVFDQYNFSDFTFKTMQELPQPYIVKGAHNSGSVARVKNNRYNCFKGCRLPNKKGHLKATTINVPLTKRAHETMTHICKTTLQNNFALKHNETQYFSLKPRLIVEQDILLDDSAPDVSYWYVANGTPIFTSIQCGQPKSGKPGTSAERVFVSIDYQRLPITLTKDSCPQSPPKPESWQRQVEIVSKLAQGIPGVVRIDIFPGSGNQDNIHFSEFTFTTSACGSKIAFKPRIADGLLYALEQGVVSPKTVTPDFVQRTVLGKSWALATLENGYHLDPEQSGAFPSPLDLCDSLNANHINYADPLWQQDPLVQLCFNVAHEVAGEPFRCVVASVEKQPRDLNDNTNEENNKKNKILKKNNLKKNNLKKNNFQKNNQENQPTQEYTYTIQSIDYIGAQMYPTIGSIMDRVEWGRAVTLFVIVSLLTFWDIGTQHKRNQYMNSILYLIAMLGVKYFTATPPPEGMFSGAPLKTIVQESYHAFRLVHPMQSHWVAISHFSTYWFKVAAWQSKSVRNMLIYEMLYESATAFINEWSHHAEHETHVRCMRLAFISAAKHYAFDDLVREYILPPFFVYGYLLPKYIGHWVGVASGYLLFH